jgi:hypothetical protein
MLKDRRIFRAEHYPEQQEKYRDQYQAADHNAVEQCGIGVCIFLLLQLNMATTIAMVELPAEWQGQIDQRD